MTNSGDYKTYVNAVKNFSSGCTSEVKVGKYLSAELEVTKDLRQSCTLAPTLSRIYLEGAFKMWKRTCHGMGVPITCDKLYTLLFAGDQVTIVSDVKYVFFILRKLRE